MAEEMLLLKKRAQVELEKLEKKAEKLSEDIENSKMNKVNWN
jgi:TPP-dependent indolepyruvate ferredoxin oxidoreductase alpha subunit